jgi:hypothetical protein
MKWLSLSERMSNPKVANPEASPAQARRKRAEFIVVTIGLVNFLAFLGHAMADKTSAFPGGGTLVNGVYLVATHGHQIAFTPAEFWFSYLHGVVFVVVHLACMILGWRLRQVPLKVNSRGL